MSFITEYLQREWRENHKNTIVYMQREEGFLETLDRVERWRKKNRVMYHKDTYHKFDPEAIYILKTHPNNGYLQRFSYLGHAIYSRRTPEALETAKKHVAAAVEKKETGGLAVWHDRAEPLDWYRSDVHSSVTAPEVAKNKDSEVLNIYYMKKGFSKPVHFDDVPKAASVVGPGLFAGHTL